MKAGIDRAVQDSVDKLQADKDKQNAAAIASKSAQLLHDPLTPVSGDKDSDIAVVEFFDYQCPYCKATEPQIEQLLKDDKHLEAGDEGVPDPRRGFAGRIKGGTRLARVRQVRGVPPSHDAA